MFNPEDNNQTQLISEVLTNNYNDMEEISLGKKEQGIPSGFYDFDALTQGFHRGDLIVLGGRPAMGKTSISLNIARNIAEMHNLPVCIFSPEISKEQITYRLMSMESGIESGEFVIAIDRGIFTAEQLSKANLIVDKISPEIILEVSESL